MLLNQKNTLILLFLGLIGDGYGASYRENKKNTFFSQPKQRLASGAPIKRLAMTEGEVIVSPPFQDSGIGLSDVTIDTPPLKDQGLRYRFKYQSSPYNDGVSLLQSVSQCLKKAIKSENVGGGASIGLCRGNGKEFLVGERFGYGSLMRKTKSPLQMAQALDQRCKQRGGNLESLFVPV